MIRLEYVWRSFQGAAAQPLGKEAFSKFLNWILDPLVARWKLSGQFWTHPGYVLEVISRGCGAAPWQGSVLEVYAMDLGTFW